MVAWVSRYRALHLPVGIIYRVSDQIWKPYSKVNVIRGWVNFPRIWVLKQTCEWGLGYKLGSLVRACGWALNKSLPRIFPLQLLQKIIWFGDIPFCCLLDLLSPYFLSKVSLWPFSIIFSGCGINTIKYGTSRRLYYCISRLSCKLDFIVSLSFPQKQGKRDSENAFLITFLPFFVFFLPSRTRRGKLVCCSKGRTRVKRKRLFVLLFDLVSGMNRY